MDRLHLPPDYRPDYRVTTTPGKPVSVVVTLHRFSDYRNPIFALWWSLGSQAGSQAKTLFFHSFFILSTKTTKKNRKKEKCLKKASESLGRGKGHFGSQSLTQALTQSEVNAIKAFSANALSDNRNAA